MALSAEQKISDDGYDDGDGDDDEDDDDEDDDDVTDCSLVQFHSQLLRCGVGQGIKHYISSNFS